MQVNLLNTERGKRMFCKQNIFKYKRNKICDKCFKTKKTLNFKHKNKCLHAKQLKETILLQTKWFQQQQQNYFANKMFSNKKKVFKKKTLFLRYRKTEKKSV